jgi:hypothetical protein
MQVTCLWRPARHLPLHFNSTRTVHKSVLKIQLYEPSMIIFSFGGRVVLYVTNFVALVSGFDLFSFINKHIFHLFTPGGT